MIKTKLGYIAIMIGTLLAANTIQDSDLDGVPDSIDICPNTPFLSTVNAAGCTTKILKLPQESERKNLTFSLGYGYSTNEDFLDYGKQHSATLQLSYYHDSYSYTLQTGYYHYDDDSDIQDTILKIKKRFHLNDTLNLSIGAGIKFPSYDFKGNKTDYTLYSALHYYPSKYLSYFSGFRYSFIGDDIPDTAVQNSYDFYLGSGYFFTSHLYANLSYSFSHSKFTDEESLHNLSTTLYYKINQQFFTTLTYQRAIGDEDLHDGITVKLGYRLW